MSGVQGSKGASSGGNRLLESLRAADAALLAPQLEPMMLTAGTVLQEPGGEPAPVIFPGRGTVLALVAVTRDGRTAEVAAIGCEGVLARQPCMGFLRILVQVGGPALCLASGRLAAAEAASATLRERIAAHDAALLAQVMQSVACAALHPVEARTSRWLLALQDRVGRAELPLTQEYLADMLGVRRTTITRVLAGMERRGLINHRRGRILVADRPALEATSCECHRLVQAQFERLAPGLYPAVEEFRQSAA